MFVRLVLLFILLSWLFAAMEAVIFLRTAIH